MARGTEMLVAAYILGSIMFSMAALYAGMQPGRAYCLKSLAFRRQNRLFSLSWVFDSLKMKAWG
jgi:hypothetical protein